MHPTIRALGIPLLITSTLAWGSGPDGMPEDSLSVREVEAHLRLLASDELAGRRTGTPGNDVASRYIAEQFRAAGARPVPGQDEYLQPVPLVELVPPESAELKLLNQRWRLEEDLFVWSGGGVQLEAPAVYVEGMASESASGRNLEGKILFTAFSRRPRDKAGAASRLGAAAVVELLDERRWSALSRFRSRSRRLSLSTGPNQPSESIPHLLILDSSGQLKRRLQESDEMEAFLTVTEPRKLKVRSRNVVGIIPGTDPELRKEYVAIVAHYDHLGSDPGHPLATPDDHIFNGAVDNGMGTVALLAAAKSLAESPPRRSVLLAAVTAEEQGLLGSRHLAREPPVPLERVVFVLNSDGGALTDPKVVTVLGLDRTSAKPHIISGCRDFGLEAISGPADVQYLFNQSDNLSFARIGIPSPTFSPGFRAFDGEARRHYHRPSDEAGDDFDYPYLLRFAQAFVRVARSVADDFTRPRWTPGDRYEAAAEALYGSRYR